MSTAATPKHVPAVGDPAPDFTLDSTAGAPVTLSALRGRRVLLAFFPAAFTSVCTTEMCSFSEDYDVFGEEGVTVLPVSVDLIPSLREFKAKYDIRADLLSDFRRDASRAYGVLLERTFQSGRAYFLVDEAGVVRWAHVEEHPGLRRENSEILAAIRAAA